jgi:hypothetical protein
MLLRPKTRAKEVKKHINTEEGQMSFLSTKRKANEVHKHNFQGKRGC